MDKDEALNKLYRYCNYQERCTAEVRQKLDSLALPADTREAVWQELLELDLFSDQRYAAAFAQGRFRQRQWGRIKIRHHLRQKGLSATTISQGLQALLPEEYEATLSRLLQQKLRTVKAANEYERKHKAARYAIGKGYEPDLVWQILKSQP